MPRGAAPLVLASVTLLAFVTGCSDTSGGAAVPATTSSSPAATSSTAPPVTTPSSTTAGPGGEGSGPTTGSAAPPTGDPTPSYFTPTDPSGYSLSGRITVDQARQDPFSNLLKRGALHGRPVTLDVVGTPDQPVSPVSPVTVLFGTCRCEQRGSGLRVTVSDGGAVTVQPSGDVAIRGTFRSVVTASDAVTLEPA